MPMAAAVDTAKENTPVDSGDLRDSEQIVEPATVSGSQIAGEWGSTGVDYALAVELGGAQRPGAHMLTGAADAEYPSLPERIRGKLS